MSEVQNTISDIVSEVTAEANAGATSNESNNSEWSENESLEASEAAEFSEETIINAAQKAGDISKKEAQALKKKLKIKVDGQEFDEEVDFEDEEGLKRHLQKSKAFDKRLKEFSGYKNQVEAAFEMLQNDPEAFLEQMGLNVDDLAEKRLSRKIDEMKKSPEQIEADKMRKELEDYKKKEKEYSERAQKAELERMKNEQATQIENDITSALDNAKSILPKRNPAVMQRVAQTMLLAMQKGYYNVTAKDVIPLVEKQYREEVASLLGTSSDEMLEMFATKERLNNYRKSQVQQRKAAPPTPNKPRIEDVGSKKIEKTKEAEPYHMKNFFSYRQK